MSPISTIMSQDQTLELKSFKSSRFCSYFFCVCLVCTYQTKEVKNHETETYEKM